MPMRPVLTLFAATLVPLVVGAIIAIVTEPGSFVFVLGFVISSVSAIVLVALAFYAVGREEDREREAQSRRRRGNSDADPARRGHGRLRRRRSGRRPS